MKFRDDVLLARGGTAINLLKGGTIGNEGGSPRHTGELEGGWFYKGLGFRATGNWQNGTRVDGLLGDTSNLRFSGVTKLDVRTFYSFSQNKSLIGKIPFLKGARVAFHIRNVFDDAIKVRDAAGGIPFRYQRPYLDAVGRNFEIDFRKQF